MGEPQYHLQGFSLSCRPNDDRHYYRKVCVTCAFCVCNFKSSQNRKCYNMRTTKNAQECCCATTNRCRVCNHCCSIRGILYTGSWTMWYGTGIGWKEFCVGNFHAMLELLSLLATIPYFSAWFALLSLFWTWTFKSSDLRKTLFLLLNKTQYHWPWAMSAIYVSKWSLRQDEFNYWPWVYTYLNWKVSF